jgi:hypothetical protein
VWVAALIGWAIAPPVAAQGTHLLIVTGLSGEPSFAASFTTSATALVDAAAAWRWPRDHVVWLAEDTTADPSRIRGRSSRAGIAAAFDDLRRGSAAGDTVVVVLMGHGSGSGAESRISVPGADPTAADYAGWLDALAGRTVVVVVAASGSGDFLPVLSRPGRVVITATRSATERNESIFGTRWVQGIASGDADGDKDGRLSALEAFDYATRAVARAYTDDHRLLTEHAVLDDDGDGVGDATPGVDSSTDGRLARRVMVGGRAGVVDPRAAPLIAERSALEAEVEALRRRKDGMSSASYLDALEALLVRIAEKTAAIRALTGEGAP